MAGIFLLLGLSVVMALASFLAGALPLSMSLSQSQLRLLSSLGIGLLVGTSMIVIIPEGIATATASGGTGHVHRIRTFANQGLTDYANNGAPTVVSQAHSIRTAQRNSGSEDTPRRAAEGRWSDLVTTISERQQEVDSDEPETAPEPHHHESEFPAAEIGLSLISGFVLMFLIDRLPRHATERFSVSPQTQHMSLDNLGGGDASVSGDSEADGFLGSLTPTPRKARSLATTVGLVIHAAADGIAMGATSTTSDLKLGFIIFLAILVHKAPAAFGLTSLLLKQGLSKRAARGHLIVFSLAAPVGALTTWLLITLLGGEHLEGASKSWWSGMLLLFSGGTFLYVAMQAMQEDGHGHGHEPHGTTNGYADGPQPSARKAKGPQVRDTMVTVVGMLLPLLAQLGHSH